MEWQHRRACIDAAQHTRRKIACGPDICHKPLQPEVADASGLLFQAHVAFVLSHIIPRHGRWPYRSGAQRWRVSAAAFSVIHAALSEMPHQPSGAAHGELDGLAM